jgi:hypothetical protein
LMGFRVWLRILGCHVLMAVIEQTHAAEVVCPENARVSSRCWSTLTVTPPRLCPTRWIGFASHHSGKRPSYVRPNRSCPK